MKNMGKVISWLNSKSLDSINKFGAQYDAFSVFVFVFYLANPFKWHFSGPYSFSIIAFLRMFAIVIWILLVFWRQWPKNFKQYLPLFWHFVLFYHLPFRTTFSTLYSSHSPSFDSFGLLGIVALAVLVDDRFFCIITLLGTSVGCLVYFAFGGFEIPLLKLPTLLYASLMVISIAFMKLVFFRNHHLKLNEKSKTYKILAGAIAHEVRGPLATINVAYENLLLSHKQDKADELRIIGKQAKKALSVIDSILLQIGYIDKRTKPDRSKQSLKECIYLAINDPQFSDKNRSKIIVDLPVDYSIKADKYLLVQVFTNLIKNAFWAINESFKGQISITASNLNNVVEISITDTGMGISPENQKKLFEPFFSQNKNGVGLGLAFCKLAIKNMNGSIRCESKKELFTRFIIRLSSADKAKREPLDDISPSMLIPNHNSTS